ncbi:hypothetical protein ACKI10_40750 [Streptomyces galilaeus]|uniref:hypothetical protein n=1 Tax=Streptomyces TaxID=1883 RepID=UPI0038F81310
MNDSARDDGTGNDDFGGPDGVEIDFSEEALRRLRVNEAHEEAVELEEWFHAEWKRYKRERIERRRAIEADPYPDYLKPWASMLVLGGVVQVPSFERPVRGTDEFEEVSPEKFTRSELLAGLRRYFHLPASFDIGDWSEFSEKEREMAEHLSDNECLSLVALPNPREEGEFILAPTRLAFNAALRRFNPSVNIATVADPVKGDRILLRDSAHQLTCTLEYDDCMECQEEDEREEWGRGLGISGKTQTIFGPKEGGKTWYEVLAAKEAIEWGYNVLHFEADDSREALPKRLVLAGVDPLDVAKRVRVIMADEIQVTTDGGGKRRPVTPEVPEKFARNIGLVTLDAVISMAGELRLDSSADTLTKTLMSTLIEPFYRRSQVGAHGIIVDHSGLQDLDRPKDSSQKLAAVGTAYQAVIIKPLGVGRLGCLELRLRKDRHSIHPGKSSGKGDVVGYMDLDARGETVRVEVYSEHPDKRSSTPKRGKSKMGEIKALIHEWLMENADDATATKDEIWDGLRGTIKSSGKPLTSADVNNNLNRLTADDPIRALSDGRYRAL